MAQLIRRRFALTLLIALPSATVIAAACSAGGDPGNPNAAGPGSGGSGAGGGLDADLQLDTGPGNPTVTLAPEKLCDPCNDFEVVEQPLVVDGAEGAPDQFAPFDGTVGGGPCISDPPNGALLPYNWTKPRIKWSGGAGPYEVRIGAARESVDFVAYTMATEFLVPRAVWFGDPDQGTAGLAANNWAEDITVTVRAAGGGASQVTFQTAPVPAGGSLVYWATDNAAAQNNDGWLEGFEVGDESFAVTLTNADVQMATRSQSGDLTKQTDTRCIGCHCSTPDGDTVAFNDGWPWNGLISKIDPNDLGAVPDYVSPGGEVTMNMPWLGIMTMSRGDWGTGARRVVTTSSNADGIQWNGMTPENNNETSSELIWLDLATPVPSAAEAAMLDDNAERWRFVQDVFPGAEGQAWGVIARNGDPRSAVAPDWSHDGTHVLYTSSTTARDGRLGDFNDTDIYRVPFNGGAGGDAVPIAGAAQAGVAEYYPDYSADGQFVAFNRVANVASFPADAELYAIGTGEIWIAPLTAGAATAGAGETAEGGAIRLRANDPDACNSSAGARSPGAFNSWPKWSPQAHYVQETDTTYYWLIFSSARDTTGTFTKNPPHQSADKRYVQLYMAPITVDASGNVTTYPAIYLWNQNQAVSNFTPAWDDFTVPEIEPIPEIY